MGVKAQVGYFVGKTEKASCLDKDWTGCPLRAPLKPVKLCGLMSFLVLAKAANFLLPPASLRWFSGVILT